MNNIELTYKLTKKLMSIKEELVDWGRLSRENKLSETHQKNMMKNAFEIDELLREIGVDWIKDYEANQKIRANLNNQN